MKKPHFMSVSSFSKLFPPVLSDSDTMLIARLDLLEVKTKIKQVMVKFSFYDRIAQRTTKNKEKRVQI